MLRSFSSKCAKLAFVFVVTVFPCSVSEAIFTTGVPEKVTFSPDSSKIAFIWSENFSWPVVDAPILKRDILLYWRNVTDTKTTKSIKVDTIGKEYSGYIDIPLDFKFSPDSRHLAVFTPNHLSVVDLESKRLWQLSDSGEKVTSFQWLNNNQIGYCIHRIGKDSVSSYERVFWRQNIKDGPETRSIIYQESLDKSEKLVSYPLEHWSPKGRYIIFLRKPYCDDSCFKLLDVKEKTVMLSFGKPKSYSVSDFFGSGISWKSDESEVFCLAGVVGKGDNQAYLVYPNTGQVFDCSKGFSQTFGDGIAPSLLPDWTPDGKYILANDYLGLGGCLIQPRPWKVVTLQEKLDKHLKLDQKYKPHLFYLPIQGWVGINAVGVDKKYATDRAAKFAFDYKGKEIIPLFDSPGIWACSPDGRSAVVIWYRKKLTLHKLAVPHVTESSDTPND